MQTLPKHQTKKLKLLHSLVYYHHFNSLLRDYGSDSYNKSIRAIAFLTDKIHKEKFK